MRKLLLPALAVLLALAAAPAAAQKQGLNPVIDLKHAAPPRAVYVAALDALEKYGYQLRMRLLDQVLVTLPAFTSDPPKPDDEASMLAVEVAQAGDSTRVIIQARLVRGDGRPVEAGDETLAHVLMAEVMISAAIDTALQALAPGAGKPDPREDSDTYGYGRRNPVRVGGGAEDGVRREHQYLEALRGPGGERVRYRRLGSCFEFTTPQGTGMLDAYQVTYDGLAQPVVLYLDMYTPPGSVPPPPAGFTSAPPATPARSG